MDFLLNINTWFTHVILCVVFTTTWIMLLDTYKLLSSTREDRSFRDGMGVIFGVIYFITVGVICGSESSESIRSLQIHLIPFTIQSIVLLCQLYERSDSKIDFFQYLLYSTFPILILGLFFI